MGAIWSRVQQLTRAVVSPEGPGRGPRDFLAGITPGAIGMPPARGTAQFLEAYATSPLLRALVGKIAAAFAAVEWTLAIPRNASGRAMAMPAWARAGREARARLRAVPAATGPQLRPVLSHPLLDEVLGRGNAWLTGYAIRKLTWIHLETVGEAFWLKERNGLGMPVAVWPLPPSWITATPTPTNPAFRVAYRGFQDMIPWSEILWLSDPAPANPYGRGSGAAQALADEYETDEYAARAAKQVFFNGARPDLLITPKESASTAWSRDDVRRMEMDWLARHQGFWKWFKPTFGTQAVEVHQFDRDFRQLQFTGVRQQIEEIAIHTLGMPPELLGKLASSNRATIEAAEVLFARWLLIPRLELFRAWVQERMLPEYDERLILDYISPVPEDREFQLKVMAAQPAAFSVDQWQTAAGHDPLPNGNGATYLIPFNLTPTADLGAPLVSPATNGTGGTRTLAPPHQTKAVASKALMDPDPALIRLANRLEPEFRRAFLRAVEAARGAIDVEALATALQSGHATLAETLARIDVLAGQLEEWRPILRQGFLQAGQVTVDDLRLAGITLRVDLIVPAAETYAATTAGRLITLISEDTRATLRDLFGQALAGTLDVREVAQRVRPLVGLTAPQARAWTRYYEALLESGLNAQKVSDKAGRYADALIRQRGEVIARTEIITSEHIGQAEVWRTAVREGLLPAETQRVWIATPDELTEAICEALDGETAGLEEPFAGGILRPPAHPQCRCTTGLVMP